MANAMQCDRCGAYFQTNTKHLKGYNGRLCGVALRRWGGGTHYICDKDLCDECLEKFERFMDGCELEEE